MTTLPPASAPASPVGAGLDAGAVGPAHGPVDEPVGILPSHHAWSAFRVARLADALAAAGLPAGNLAVTEFFLIDGAAPREALRGLLGPGPDQLPAGADVLYVVPRLGTLSAWSSKATDIARVCGLAGVRRIEQGRVVHLGGVAAATLTAAQRAALHDPMLESIVTEPHALAGVFAHPARRGLRTVPVAAEGEAALVRANADWGLALSPAEITYLAEHFAGAGQDPTDAELMMFAQVNSEHCRHKIFNAAFTLDGVSEEKSLFAMIKDSYHATPGGVLSAYSDNAAVVAGPTTERFFPHPDGTVVQGADQARVWDARVEPVHTLMKVETHNHPTGISPHPGAATGSGGEIRDEAATGRGAKPKAGLVGYTVANLRIPGLVRPWEAPLPRPARVAPALSIMLEAPLGASAYNNEFGRPCLAGYFRPFEATTPDGRNRGYHKPVMIAGGHGSVRPGHVLKEPVTAGTKLLVLGGPALLIGLGGGAASSLATGAQDAGLDFASVQRANPELQRRAQQVVDDCWALGEANPILSIHDVGAGGISNALPELVHADGRGGRFQLRDVLSADPSLSPMEIWCNESQERYVLAVAPEGVATIEAFCRRERCPVAVVGTATVEERLLVEDAALGAPAVDMPMPVLLGKPPRMQRATARATPATRAFDATAVDLNEAVRRVLAHPAVASKSFLITIGDRTVGGLTVRDQFVGPWQVPVADCAVTLTGYAATTGEAMSMGERPVLALLDAPASGRMAVAEAVTNLMGAKIDRLEDIRLSANWMAACGQGDEDARLYDTVRAVGSEFCPALGLAIPVGKDSLSMKSQWATPDGGSSVQTAPLTLIVSAFAQVTDVRRTLTPQLVADADTRLVLLDFGLGRNRLGGSILAQVYSELGQVPPDLDEPAQLRAGFALVQRWNDGRLLALHDRADGGLLATLAEMAFAGRTGLMVSLDALGPEPRAALFTEEAGVVVQLGTDDAARFIAEARALGLKAEVLGAPTDDDRLSVVAEGAVLWADARARLLAVWSETSHAMARLRDNPACADEELAARLDENDDGLSVRLSFAPVAAGPTPAATAPNLRLARPRVAILREQGVNGQAEMAWAFHRAGFEAVDVHMSDILDGRLGLDGFQALAACGGFSYGDVLGAGQGWAKTILFSGRGREQFARFFDRPDTLSLGVCNGCQMFAALKSLVPGAEAWPAFVTNRSERFEARWGLVEVLESTSVFLNPMAGSRLPIAVAHGEGRALFAAPDDLAALKAGGQVALRYVTNAGAVAERYPANPNGSPEGLASVASADGRVTILMPHPERTVAPHTGSWWGQDWSAAGATPWLRMFQGAREWLG